MPITDYVAAAATKTAAAANHINTTVNSLTHNAGVIMSFSLQSSHIWGSGWVFVNWLVEYMCRTGTMASV